MTLNVKNSDLPSIKIHILNWTRGNSGYTADQCSRTLSIPLSVVHQAVAELKKEGLLDPKSPTLKIGRRQS